MEEIIIEHKTSWEDEHTLIPKSLIMNKELDNYSLGIYLRLDVLCYQQKQVEEIYKYGSKDYVDRALQKLHSLGLIQWDGENIKL